MLLFGKYYGFSVYKYYMLHISLIGFCEMCKKYFCAWCFIWEMGLQFGIYNIFGVWLYFQFWYFTYGTKDVLERECKDLHTKLKVSLIASSLSHVTLLCVTVSQTGVTVHLHVHLMNRISLLGLCINIVIKFL